MSGKILPVHWKNSSDSGSHSSQLFLSVEVCAVRDVLLYNGTICSDVQTAVLQNLFYSQMVPAHQEYHNHRSLSDMQKPPQSATSDIEITLLCQWLILMICASVRELCGCNINNSFPCAFRNQMYKSEKILT